jgi:hypothetical protein
MHYRVQARVINFSFPNDEEKNLKKNPFINRLLGFSGKNEAPVRHHTAGLLAKLPSRC